MYKKEIDKLMDFDAEHRVYCSCRKYTVVFYNKDTDRLVCKACGKWIYKDAKTKLKYLLNKKD